LLDKTLLEWKLNNDETVFIFSLDMLSTNISDGRDIVKALRENLKKWRKNDGGKKMGKDVEEVGEELNEAKRAFREGKNYKQVGEILRSVESKLQELRR